MKCPTKIPHLLVSNFVPKADEMGNFKFVFNLN